MGPKIGDTAVCSMCSAIVEYVGPYWRHVGSEDMQPRHPAIPMGAPVGRVEEKQPATYQEYIVATPDAALITNVDWLRIWLNGMAATHKRLIAVYHMPSTWQPVFIFEDTAE